MKENKCQMLMAVLIFPVLIGTPLLCEGLFHLLFPDGSLSRFNILIFLYLLFSLAAPFLLLVILYCLLCKTRSSRNGVNKAPGNQKAVKKGKSISVNEVKIAVSGACRLRSRVVQRLAKAGVRDVIQVDRDYASGRNPEVPGMAGGEQIRWLHAGKLPDQNDMPGRNSFGPVFKPRTERIYDKTGGNRLTGIFRGVRVCLVTLGTLNGLKRLSAFLTSRMPVIYGGMTARGGGFILFTLPGYRTPCFIHSMGMNSFEELRELEAVNANIAVKDADIISQWMVKIARYLLVRRADKDNVFSKINEDRSNLLFLEKVSDLFYQPIWVRHTRSYQCPLCRGPDIH